MYVVVVEIEIQPGSEERFMGHMREQARASLAEEPGCHQFDVCVDPENATKVLLYEVYDDAVSFEVHLKMPYFAPFDAAVQPLMASKTVRTFERVEA